MVTPGALKKSLWVFQNQTESILHISLRQGTSKEKITEQQEDKKWEEHVRGNVQDAELESAANHKRMLFTLRWVLFMFAWVTCFLMYGENQ